MDYMEARNDHMGVDDDGVVLDIMDLGTGFVGIFPVKSRSAVETTRAARQSIGRKRASCLYTDRADEFIATPYALALPCDHPKAGRPQMNGIIERQNQEIKRGTKAMLTQAGLPPPFWHLAICCYAHHQNTQVADGTSAWSKRHGDHYSGELFPFGCRVLYKPLFTTAIGASTHKFDKDTDSGIFVGYELKSGM